LKKHKQTFGRKIMNQTKNREKRWNKDFGEKKKKGG
jgi:hypothetical protein